MVLERCNSIQDCIEYGKQLEFAHHKLYDQYFIKVNNEKVLLTTYLSILTDYMPVIKKTLVNYVFTDEDFITYKYKPKMFCRNKYGTMELWSLLLRVNHMTSVMDFTQKDIKIFDENIIFSLLNEIIILEQKRIEQNQIEIDKKWKDMSTDK